MDICVYSEATELINEALRQLREDELNYLS